MQFLSPTLARSIAHREGILPSKKFGQNFMVDAAQVQKIVRLAGLIPGDEVLEVGPGLGSLTLGLLDAGVKVTAVEIDQRLANLLPVTINELAPEVAADLGVLKEDALKLHEIGSAKHLVSNLPYNVATPILITLLERFEQIEDALVLVQAEVAERICAEPGNKVYGIPSAKIAWFGTAKIAGTIPRSAFWPVPRVNSKLVLFKRSASIPSASRENTFALVNLAFSQRRKTLRSLLVQDGYDGDKITALLDSLQIDPLARGETLSIVQFAEISSRLSR